MSNKTLEMPNSDLVSSPRFPHPHSIVRNGRGNQSSARMKSSMIDRAIVNQDVLQLASVRIPQPRGAVHTGGQNALAVGAEFSNAHMVAMLQRRRERFSG